jgi:ATP-dependent Clp protease ATP-binding subunit ClpC
MCDARLMSLRGNSVLGELRLLALRFAEERAEAVSTGHLLWALCSNAEASELLLRRRITSDIVVRGLRVATDDVSGSFERTMSRARDAAVRHMPRAEPGPRQDPRSTLLYQAAPQRSAPSARLDARGLEGLHLLFALCHDSKTAAYRILEQCGVDVGKLRLAAIQAALGIPETIKAKLVIEPQPEPVRIKSPPAEVVAPPALAPVPLRAKVVEGSKSRKVRHAPSLTAKAFPVLSQIGSNLTERRHRDGEAMPTIVGRDEEVERVLDILAKKNNNAPCLVGAPGVGKTSVVHALVARLSEEEPQTLVIEVSPSTLLQETGLRGQLAEKFKQIRVELERSKGSVVLFLDDLHGLLIPEFGDEAIAELKALLGRGEFRCICATSTEEYERTVGRDPSLARRFVPVDVAPLDRDEAFLALSYVAPSLEVHHKTQIADEVLALAVAWTLRYAANRPLLDTAQQLVDLSAARAKRKHEASLTKEGLAEVAADVLHIPKERLLESDGARMLKFEQLMEERVVGHHAQIEKIGKILRRNASGIVGKRPIGVFLLLGPTGVGKTETAKAVASALFFSAESMTRIDMSEYSEPHAVARLIGAPPGYVGFESGGQLTEAIRKRPYQVLLLDEIEKAHQDVLETFLQVFDEGRLTDGRGRTVDFTNTVIFATSNLGADVSSGAEPTAIGFGRLGKSGTDGAQGSHVSPRDARVIASARKGLRPEFFNRFDEALVFGPLERAEMSQIAMHMVARLSQNLTETRGVSVEADVSAVELLLREGGFEPELGARPMRRAIARLLEAPLADLLLRGTVTRGDCIRISTRAQKLCFDAVSRKSESSQSSEGALSSLQFARA